MILFSHYISTYLVRKTIEETSRQKNVLAQNIENEIDSINSIMNNIYYNTIKNMIFRTGTLKLFWQMKSPAIQKQSMDSLYMIQMAKTYGTLTI